MDQAQQWASAHHLSADYLQLAYTRCHDFLDHDASSLGDANDWLARASAQAQPVAQSVTANRVLMQQSMQAMQAQMGLAPGSIDQPDWAVSHPSDPHALLLQAVQSKDPQVLFQIGEAQGLLSAPDGQAQIDMMAWRVVACRRGLDCSMQSDLMRVACAYDTRCASFDNFVDFFHSLADPDEWDEVEQRASQIDAALNSNQWDQLGLNAPT
jgi:hypothetical protein